MPDDRNQLIAYLATLGALATVFISALVAASIAPALLGKLEVFGLGTITGGLIGVLRMPTRNAQVGSPAQDDALKTLADKVPPQTGEAAS